MLNLIRRSLLLDSLNLYSKAHFSSRKKKYAAKLAFAELIWRQSKVPYAADAPQIFIDISGLVGEDGKTGIHRVVRSVATYVSRTGV